MADSSSSGTVRVPDWMADELDKIVHSYPRGQRPTRGDLVAQAWRKAKSIPNPDESAIVKSEQPSSPTSAGDDASPTVVLRVVPGLPQWNEQHEALEEILNSDHPVASEAIKKNLEAFRELVKRARDDRAADLLSGSERVPGGEVGEVHSRVEHHEQAYDAEAKHIQRPPDRRKRSHKPEKRTG